MTRTATALIAILLCAPLAPAAEISWRYAYGDAIKEAASAGKPVVLEFVTDNCIRCEQADATAFADTALADRLNRQFVPLRVYVPGKAPHNHRGASIGRAMQVTEYPTLFVLSPRRAILDRFAGVPEPITLKRALDKALKGSPERLPDPKGATALAAAVQDLPTGVDPSKLADHPQYRYGNVVKPADALEADNLPDLAGKPYLTVVARDAAVRKQILDAVAASPLGPKVRAQGQAPDHWHLEPFKLLDDQQFQRSGLALYLQSPPARPGGFGTVREQAYAWNAAVQTAFERKADPGWDPNGTAGLSVPPLAWIAVIGVAILVFWPTRGSVYTEGDNV